MNRTPLTPAQKKLQLSRLTHTLDTAVETLNALGRQNSLTADGPLSGISSEDDYTPEMIKQLERRAERKIADERKNKDDTAKNAFDAMMLPPAFAQNNSNAVEAFDGLLKSLFDKETASRK